VLALQRYCENHGGKLQATLHTFGFGYDLDSRLLENLARIGNGMYVFIPDAGFVGTALVNCISNVLVTVAQNVKLAITPYEGCSVRSVVGYASICAQQAPLVVPIGSLQSGQAKDVIVSVSSRGTQAGQTLLSVTLAYDGLGGPVSKSAVASVPATNCASERAEATVQRLRLLFVDKVLAAVHAAGTDGGGLANARAILQQLQQELAAADLIDERIAALQQDVDGQVSEALSREDWYRSWGVHYLLSIARAHRMQQCSNFKDPGVQVYGGELFEKIRDRADEEFNQLPAPKPSMSRPSFGAHGSVASTPVNMAAYNDRFAG
jgi:hypothetical protein